METTILGYIGSVAKSETIGRQEGIYIGIHWGNITVILGLSRGSITVILGLYWDSAKENGNYYLGFRVEGCPSGKEEGKDNGNYYR